MVKEKILKIPGKITAENYKKGRGKSGFIGRP